MGTLSARFVQTITKPGRYGDGGGLYLQVSGTAAKSWIFIYRFKGRRPSFGLGSVSAVTLAQAREKTKDARRLLAERRDPIAERRSQELAGEIEIARQTTFRQITEDYIAIKDAESKHGDVGRMTRSQFRLHVFPLIGDLPVSAITLEVVLKVLRPIWHKRPNTANHIRMRMEHILTRSKVLGMRSAKIPLNGETTSIRFYRRRTRSGRWCRAALYLSSKHRNSLPVSAASSSKKDICPMRRPTMARRPLCSLP